MKLTLQQIALLKHVLANTDERTPRGEWVPRTFNANQVSGYNWFEKNTQEVLDKHDELVAKKREALEKKYKKELEEQGKAIATLQQMLSKADPKKEADRADAYTKLIKFLNKESIKMKIEKELNEDKELQASFLETKNEVEVRENTKNFMIEVLKEAKFTAEFAPLVEVMEDLKVI